MVGTMQGELKPMEYESESEDDEEEEEEEEDAASTGTTAQQGYVLEFAAVIYHYRGMTALAWLEHDQV